MHSIENEYNIFEAMKNIEGKMIGNIFEAFLWSKVIVLSNQMKWWDWSNRDDIEMEIKPTTTHCLQWIEWKYPNIVLYQFNDIRIRVAFINHHKCICVECWIEYWILCMLSTNCALKVFEEPHKTHFNKLNI